MGRCRTYCPVTSPADGPRPSGRSWCTETVLWPRTSASWPVSACCCFGSDHVVSAAVVFSAVHVVSVFVLAQINIKCVCCCFGSITLCACCLFGSDHVCTVVLAQITLCLLLVWLRSCVYYCFGSDHFVSAVVLAQIMLCLLLEWLRSCCVWCWFGSDHVCLVLFWLRSCICCWFGFRIECNCSE